jgi:hypothetical protein
LGEATSLTVPGAAEPRWGICVWRRIGSLRPYDSMFANLVQLISGRAPAPEAVREAFIEDIAVRHVPRRSRRVEFIILAGWVLITVKHVAIIWACRHYPVPFHQLWVNFPTWLLGALATAVYYGRLRRR